MKGLKLYGLVGRDLGHSFSQQWFAAKFGREGICDAEYRNFPLADISELPCLLGNNPGLRGFNVTIPYKKSIIPYLSSIDGAAQRIGAVNCVVVERGGSGGGRGISGNISLSGYNTDAPAFRETLMTLIGTARPDALVLGSGGASKAVCCALSETGIRHTVVSRTPADGMLSYDELDGGIVDAHRLIVNTTPLGMSPYTDGAPGLPYDAITPRHFICDLIYNPTETVFLQRGRERGAKTANGYAMLVRQAELSWEIWNRRQR